MGAVYFYHMTRSPLGATLPLLLTKSIGAGWRVLLRAQTPEQEAHVDDLLWTHDPGSFLPHGRDDPAGVNPVLIGNQDTALAGREALISVFGAEIGAEEAQASQRGMILFDGQDESAVAHARTQWKTLTGAGIAAQYWSDAEGSWQMKAEAGAQD